MCVLVKNQKVNLDNSGLTLGLKNIPVLKASPKLPVTVATSPIVPVKTFVPPSVAVNNTPFIGLTSQVAKQLSNNETLDLPVAKKSTISAKEDNPIASAVASSGFVGGGGNAFTDSIAASNTVNADVKKKLQVYL